MAGLQRSTATFRRSGSSGMVWEEKFSAELIQKMENNKLGTDDQVEFRELRQSRSTGSTGLLQRSLDSPGIVLHRSSSKGKGGRGSSGLNAVAHCTAMEVPPAVDPPSPKVSACGFCGIFSSSKPVAASHMQRAKKGKQ